VSLAAWDAVACVVYDEEVVDEDPGLAEPEPFVCTRSYID
jgi:hypothetical protein